MIRILVSYCLLSSLLISEVSATKHVIVVLDNSGSMNEPMARQNVTRMLAAKRALLKVIQILPDDTHIGVILLNRRMGKDPWIIPLGPVEIGQVESLLDQVQAGGGTPLGQFMKVAADALLEARKKNHYGSYRLLLVTDGEASDSRLVNRYLPDILSRGLTVDVIGVDMAETHSLATRVHSYRQANNPDSLTKAVSEVFAETTANAADAGDSDFELLEALPDEMAVAALAALSSGGNSPIEGAQRNSQRKSSHKDRGSSTRRKKSDKGGGMPLLVWLAVAFFVINVFAKMFRGKSRR